MKHMTLAATILAGAVLALPAWARSVSYHADLTGASEVPPTTSKGTGEFKGTLDPTTKVLTYTMTFSGLTGPATKAHIHGPAPVGKNAGVLYAFPPPLTNPIKGTATLKQSVIDDMNNGMTYVNIHTAANASGEIRGQIDKGR